MLITVQISTTTQRLHSFKFTLVNKSHSQHSEAVVRCLGHHFPICMHAHMKCDIDVDVSYLSTRGYGIIHDLIYKHLEKLHAELCMWSMAPELHSIILPLPNMLSFCNPFLHLYAVSLWAWQ